MVQTSAAFGCFSTNLASVIRGVLAIKWYEFQIRRGTTSLNQDSVVMFDFDNIVRFFRLPIRSNIVVSTKVSRDKMVENYR